MFNAYFYSKSIRNAEEKEISDKKHLKSISAQVKFRDKLVTNNKKRTEKRILEMSNEPVPINRHEVSTKLPVFKGESFIRHRPKDKSERIKEAEVKNI